MMYQLDLTVHSAGVSCSCGVSDYAGECGVFGFWLARHGKSVMVIWIYDRGSFLTGLHDWGGLAGLPRKQSLVNGDIPRTEYHRLLVLVLERRLRLFCGIAVAMGSGGVIHWCI